MKILLIAFTAVALTACAQVAEMSDCDRALLALNLAKANELAPDHIERLQMNYDLLCPMN